MYNAAGNRITRLFGQEKRVQLLYGTKYIHASNKTSANDAFKEG